MRAPRNESFTVPPLSGHRMRREAQGGDLLCIANDPQAVLQPTPFLPVSSSHTTWSGVTPAPTWST